MLSHWCTSLGQSCPFCPWIHFNVEEHQALNDGLSGIDNNNNEMGFALNF